MQSRRSLSLFVGPAIAGTYKFYLSCQDGHRAFVNAKYGDIDPGKEYARVSVVKKFAPFHGNACMVADYRNQEQCRNCQWERFEAASLDGTELTRLSNGDLTVVPEVVVGVPLKTVEKVGKAAEKVGKEAIRVIKRLKLPKL